MKKLSDKSKGILALLPLAVLFLFLSVYYFFLEPIVFSESESNSLFVFLCLFSASAYFLSIIFLLLRLLVSRFHTIGTVLGILFFLCGETIVLIKGIFNLGLYSYDFIFLSGALVSLLVYFSLFFSMNELDSTKADMEGYL